MSNGRLLELWNRKLAGEASPEEWQELQTLLSADPEGAERFRTLEQFWSRQDEGSPLSVEENLQKVLSDLGLSERAGMEEAVQQNPSLSAGRHGSVRMISYGKRVAAAIVISVIGLSALLLYRNIGTHNVAPAPVSALLEKHNSKGTKSIIQLTDGSRIWLNADSKIRYPEVFKGINRDIYLNGEAFFDVAKNPGHPFIIHLANGTVQVLGTSFNVRAYDNEAVVETSVTTGKVAFIPKYQSARKRQDTVYLTPDHKARYVYNQEELSTIPTSGAEDKAWTEGKLIFRSLTLAEIAVELDRNFGKKVVFIDEAPKAFTFTGSFGNNSLEEIMYYLSRTKNFTYKITNTELLIATSADRLP